MTKVLELTGSDDPREALQEAVQRLAEGELVVFPTDCGYVVAADPRQPAGVQRLSRVAERLSGAAGSLAVKGLEEALDYVPSMSRLGQKLARRCWPGPVVLVFDSPQERSLLDALSADARNWLTRHQNLAFRVVAHDALQSVLRLIPSPLLLAGDIPGKGVWFHSANELLQQVGDDVALALDDGPSRYNLPASVIRVEGESWSLVSEGIVTQRTLGRRAGDMFLFICTGNTCRSPMAEGLFRKLIAERLKCADEDLVDRGVVVVSAGLAAASGSPPSPESVQILQDRGVDLQSHASQPLTPRLLRQADHIFTMTRNHRETILDSFPELEERVELLARDGSDISDPMGYGLDEYQRCAGEIERHLIRIVGGLRLAAG
jgi:protein-tyrosine phosphatase